MRYPPRYGPGNNRPIPCGPDPVDNWTKVNDLKWTRRIDDENVAVIFRTTTHWILAIDGPREQELLHRRQQNFKTVREAIRITERGNNYKSGIKFA